MAAEHLSADESLDEVPPYYVLELPGGGVTTVMDVIESRQGNFNVGCVLKYVLRAGLKPGQPRAKDLRKALRCLQRELARVEADDGRARTG